MVADEVYESIKALLMDDAFEPYTRLTTDWIATELGVSRTPVRESLARLETEGLLVKRPMAGYHVAPQLDRNGLEELYTVRLLLEPAAARLAASSATAAQLNALAPKKLGAVPNRHATYREYRSAASEDARFHDGVAEASGNALLRQAISRLHASVHTYRLWAHTSDLPIAATEEHTAVLDALRQRDPAAAEAAMRAHLDGAQARLRVAFD